jgi:hypothetical protein
LPAYEGICAKCKNTARHRCFASKPSGRSILPNTPSEYVPEKSSVNNRVCPGCYGQIARLMANDRRANGTGRAHAEEPAVLDLGATVQNLNNVQEPTSVVRVPESTYYALLPPPSFSVAYSYQDLATSAVPPFSIDINQSTHLIQHSKQQSTFVRTMYRLMLQHQSMLLVKLILWHRLML